jgi:hypothetical protein
MSGSGGSSGTQKFEWNEGIAPYWRQGLEQSRVMRDKPYERFPGQRLAGLDPRHLNAAGAVDNFVGSGGSPTTIAANGQAYNTLSDHYLTGPGANPFASQGNEYSGMDSPFFRDVMQNNMQDVTEAYKNGTAADTTRMFNMAGAFGGSAHQNKMANNEAGLGRTLSRLATDMSNDQYNRSAGLEESRLTRGSGAFENERGRQMGAIGAGQNEQNLFFDRISKMMGMGDMFRANEQDQLNLGYQDWQDAQNNPYKMMDWFTGILSRAQGGVAPNMTSNQPGFGASPYAGLLGAGLTAYGLSR